MSTILQKVKRGVPLRWRTRLRRSLAWLPGTRWLARVPLSEWNVDFLLGGAMKAGTTALSSFLDQHPEIHMPPGKEAHFFDVDDNFPPDGSPDYRSYHARYCPPATTRILGDATPLYLYQENVAPRVACYNPRMKWILLLRHPVERAHSHWNMNRVQGREPLDFLAALDQEPNRRTTPQDQRWYSYFDRGYYARQLRHLLRYFPRRQLLILRTEDLAERHDETLRLIFSFLEVDSRLRIDAGRVHCHPHEAPIPAPAWQRGQETFHQDMRELEELLGWDLSSWRDRR
ncbi:MAG: sulfotransferase family protein [Gemmataceae bacterium]